jgi:hypothetical protein
MDWMFLSPEESYVEALTLNMTLVSDGACEEVIKMKWSNEGGALTQED